MSYNSVIFDLDGTLTDSGKGIMDSAEYALKKMGCDAFERDELRVFIGPPLVETFSRFGIPADKIDEAIATYRVHYNAEGKFNNFPYEGISELLERLKNDGVHLYVGTSKPEAMAVDIMTCFDLAKYFDVIAGASTDHSRENKAAVLQHLLDQTDICDAVMVGDTVFDVEGANALGIPCIGVAWGYGNIEEMKNAGAISISATMEELYKALRG